MLAKQVTSAAAAYALAATAQSAAAAVQTLLNSYFTLTGNKLQTGYKLLQSTGWRDMQASLTNGRATGSNVPNWSTIVNGIDAWSFSATVMNELWISFHVDHDYKVGSLVHMHVHWLPSTTGLGTVRWGLEYTVAKGHSQQAFGLSQTIYIEQAASGTQFMHQVAEHAAGLDLGLEPDTVVLVRLFRDAAHPNDTYAGAAFGIFCDLHYQTERYSTPQKAPNFYTGD
jgi:hypothetical protein